MVSIAFLLLLFPYFLLNVYMNLFYAKLKLIQEFIKIPPRGCGSVRDMVKLFIWANVYGACLDQFWNDFGMNDLSKRKDKCGFKLKIQW